MIEQGFIDKQVLNPDTDPSLEAMKMDLVEKYGYTEEEIAGIDSIEIDKKTGTHYLYFNERYSRTHFERIPDPEIKKALIAIADMINAINQTEDKEKVWFLFGSTAASVQGGKTIGVPEDIDGMFDRSLTEKIASQLHISPGFIPAMETESEYDTETESAYEIETGAQKLSGNWATGIDSQREMELFGQRTTPTNEDLTNNEEEMEGFINPGYELVIVHRYKIGDTYINFADRNALTKFYVRLFASEFANFDYETYREDETIKLKHAKRLSMVHNLGIDTFEKLMEALKDNIPQQMPQSQEAYARLTEQLQKMYKNFQELTLESDEEFSLTHELIKQENERRKSLGKNPLELAEARGSQLEQAAELLAAEAAEDIDYLHTTNQSKRKLVRELFELALPPDQFGELIAADQLENIYLDNEDDPEGETMAIISQHVQANPDAQEKIHQLLGELLDDSEALYENLAKLKSKYGTYYKQALSTDEFGLFTMVDKLERLFVDRLQWILDNYIEDGILLKELLVGTDMEPKPPTQKQAEAAKEKAAKRKKKKADEAKKKQED